VPVEPGRDRVFRSATGHQVADDHARLIEALQRSSAAEQLHDDASPVAPMAEEDLDVEALMVQGPEEDLSLPLAESEAAEDGSEIVQDQPGGDRMTLISKLKPMEKIRLALLGSAFERSVLIRDANKSVALSAIKSPRVKESEVVAYSATRTLHHEVIRHIARRRDWSKLYAVKLNLVLNPKCPMATAMTFLGHLHAHDVRKVAHSRSIPSALAQAAKRKMNQRR
jgi:hypothetical protein